MKCRFCFATFQDVGKNVLPKGHLTREGCLSVVEALASAGFDKINFAGGEPTLCPWLPDLIRRAKEVELTTSIVTNGSRITPEWLDRVGNSLDWAAVSIDTVDPEKLASSGRTTHDGPLSEDDYLGVIDLLKQRGIRLKINTVVSRSNCGEALTGFIARARPERWKLLQVLPVSGQNDGLVDDQLVTLEEFAAYVARNQRVEDLGVAVVPEDNGLMTGSYVMV
ncbi:MAG: viperin family antiviral radical SAM protein, partial [Dehalococcoidia bacterium]|nr:viperin family antiviral radical SAM protein [Dehalococcoidia bacterium]